MDKPAMMIFSHLCNANHMTGAEKLLLLLAKELRPYFQCILVVPQEGLLAAELRAIEFEVIIQPCPLLWKIYETSALLETELQQMIDAGGLHPIMNLLHMKQPDLVLTNTCVHVLPAVAANTIGIPVVWHITETIPNTEWSSISVSMIDRYSDWISGISHSVLNVFSGHSEIEHKTIVLYPACNELRLAPEQWLIHRQQRRALIGLGDEDLIVGYVSSDIYPNKGLEHFILMAASLSEDYPRVHFLVAGNPVDPPYLNLCETMIQQFGLSDRFHFISFENEVGIVYAMLDLLVVPSLADEGFGMIALEALVGSKPVIAYKSGGLIEILSHAGVSNGLAEKGNVESLASIVRSFLSDRAQLHHIGQIGRQMALETFGLDAYRKRLQPLIAMLNEKTNIVRTAHQANRKLLSNAPFYRGAFSFAVFQLEFGTKRPFINERVFHLKGGRWSKVKVIPDSELHVYPTGQPILELSSPKRTLRKKRKLVLKRKKGSKNTKRSMKTKKSRNKIKNRKVS